MSDLEEIINALIGHSDLVCYFRFYSKDPESISTKELIRKIWFGSANFSPNTHMRNVFTSDEEIIMKEGYELIVSIHTGLTNKRIDMDFVENIYVNAIVYNCHSGHSKTIADFKRKFSISAVKETLNGIIKALRNIDCDLVFSKSFFPEIKETVVLEDDKLVKACYIESVYRNFGEDKLLKRVFNTKHQSNFGAPKLVSPKDRFYSADVFISTTSIVKEKFLAARYGDNLAYMGTTHVLSIYKFHLSNDLNEEIGIIKYITGSKFDECIDRIKNIRPYELLGFNFYIDVFTREVYVSLSIIDVRGNRANPDNQIVLGYVGLDIPNEFVNCVQALKASSHVSVENTHFSVTPNKVVTFSGRIGSGELFSDHVVKSTFEDLTIANIDFDKYMGD